MTPKKSASRDRAHTRPRRSSDTDDSPAQRLRGSASSLEAAWLIGYVGAWQSKEVFGDLASIELGSVEEGISRLDQRVREILHQETGDLDSVDDLVCQVYRKLNAALRRGPLADFEASTIELARTVGLAWARRQRGATQDVGAGAESVIGARPTDLRHRMIPAVASSILETWQGVIRYSKARVGGSRARRGKRR